MAASLTAQLFQAVLDPDTSAVSLIKPVLCSSEQNQAWYTYTSGHTPPLLVLWFKEPNKSVSELAPLPTYSSSDVAIMAVQALQ